MIRHRKEIRLSKASEYMNNQEAQVENRFEGPGLIAQLVRTSL